MDKLFAVKASAMQFAIAAFVHVSVDTPADVAVKMLAERLSSARLPYERLSNGKLMELAVNELHTTSDMVTLADPRTTLESPPGPDKTRGWSVDLTYAPPRGVTPTRRLLFSVSIPTSVKLFATLLV